MGFKNMDLIFQQSKCKKCGMVLLEPKDEKRTPCPVCGDTARIHEVEARSTIVFRDHIRAEGRHKGRGKPFFDIRAGADFYYKEQEWCHLERIIDRDNNLYIEKITNPKTGQVIKEIKEPLTEHKGHGSAKKKKT